MFSTKKLTGNIKNKLEWLIWVEIGLVNDAKRRKTNNSRNWKQNSGSVV